MLLSPAISPQTWWQTDRQTHTQTHTHRQTHRHTDKPSGEVKNIIPFFKGIKISFLPHCIIYSCAPWNNTFNTFDNNNLSKMYFHWVITLSKCPGQLYAYSGYMHKKWLKVMHIHAFRIDCTKHTIILIKYHHNNILNHLVFLCFYPAFPML